MLVFFYYPFGMLQPGRKFTSGSLYRYGFNGKENDNEVKGEGNQQDYGMRIYDPRLGKFLSVDPLSAHYPYFSPYQFAGNKPIWAIDVDGLEPAETSTNNAPKELAPVTVYATRNKKKQEALNFLVDNMPAMNHVWKGNISAENFADHLRQRILNPYGMDQGHSTGPGGGTNFCWIAAAASHQFDKDPKKMTAFFNRPIFRR